MNALGEEEAGRTGELAAKLRRLRAFGALRRTLRVTEDATEIAALARRFALDVLGLARFAIYCAEKDEAPLDLLAPAPDATGLPESIERTEPLVADLETSAVLRDAGILEAFAGEPGDRVVLALRGSPEQLIGIVLVAGTSLDQEMLDELVFDVESALAARMITRLRAEELAVLEIQERELVGLLRDVEARDAIIQQDLEEARLFQRKMLGEPPEVPHASVEVVYQPLGLVGGDLYAVSLDGDKLRLFVADATGHGVRASLTTMFIKSGYEAVRHSAPDPALLLAALNDTIAHTYRSAEMLFSAACVDVDLTSGRVLVASAAHPAVCVVRAGEATFLEGGGAFLGLRAGMKYTVSETSLADGDAVYLFTDGFVEARKQNEQFGEERLEAVILDAHRSGGLAGERIVAAVTEFLDGGALEDDGTVVGVRFRRSGAGDPGAEAP
ncbi:MAG: serine/threonine-protein phosphatase [Labilithrix sp.]|nr:serine/threonine-protein phosphatase [Labilithrix sp.]MCW5831998.1 serine/threonine-protein phosphatase [Labilithrix sp.]